MTATLLSWVKFARLMEAQGKPAKVSNRVG